MYNHRENYTPASLPFSLCVCVCMFNVNCFNKTMCLNRASVLKKEIFVVKFEPNTRCF